LGLLLIKEAVNVSHKDMKSEESNWQWFYRREDNEVLNPKPFNIKGFSFLFKSEEKNKYSLGVWMLRTQFLMLLT
jgi:hypothetical protein